MRRLAFALTFLCAVAAGCSREPVPSEGASGEVRAASVSIVNAAGLEAKIAAHRGRGLLINLWAIW